MSDDGAEAVAVPVAEPAEAGVAGEAEPAAVAVAKPEDPAAVEDPASADEPAAPPAAAWESGAATAAEPAEAAAGGPTASTPEEREKWVGVKIARDFGGTTYVGEIQSSDVSNGFDIYRVTYRDGDKEDLELAEVETAHQKYNTLQEEMWNTVVKLVGLGESDLDKLQSEGITNMSELELFGGATANPFTSLDLPLMKLQQLHVVATYLLNNDGHLTQDCKLVDMAKFNLQKATGALDRKKPAALSPSPAKRGRGRTKKVISAAAAKKAKSPSPAKRGRGQPRKNPPPESTTKRGVGRPRKTETAAAATSAAVAATASSEDAPPKRGRGRPRKNPETASVAPGSPKEKRGPGRPRKNPPPSPAATVGTVSAPKRGRGRPRKNPPSDGSVAPSAKKAKVSSERQELYRGPPLEPLEGVDNWPGTASQGWTYVEMQRASSTHIDRQWISPAGNILRSKVAVRKFIKAVIYCEGDETEALKIYKGFNA